MQHPCTLWKKRAHFVPLIHSHKLQCMLKYNQGKKFYGSDLPYSQKFSIGKNFEKVFGFVIRNFYFQKLGRFLKSI